MKRRKKERRINERIVEDRERGREKSERTRWRHKKKKKMKDFLNKEDPLTSIWLNNVSFIDYLSLPGFHYPLMMIESMFHFLNKTKFKFSWYWKKRRTDWIWCWGWERGEKEDGVVLLFVPRRISCWINSPWIMFEFFWSSNSDEKQQIAQTDCISGCNKNFLEKARKVSIRWSFSYTKIQRRIFFFQRKEKEQWYSTKQFFYTAVWHKLEDSDESLKSMKESSFNEQFFRKTIAP